MTARLSMLLSKRTGGYMIPSLIIDPADTKNDNINIIVTQPQDSYTSHHLIVFKNLVCLTSSMPSDLDTLRPLPAAECSNGEMDSFQSTTSKMDSMFGEMDMKSKAKSRPSSADINIRHQGPFDNYLEVERPRTMHSQQEIDGFGSALVERAQTTAQIEVDNKLFPEHYDRHAEAYKFDNHAEPVQHKLLEPVKRKALGTNGEPCNIATNHYHMNLSDSEAPTQFYEYKLQVLPGHDDAIQHVYLQALPTVHKKSAISAAIRLLKERQKRSLTGLATDYDHVLLSLTPLYDSGTICTLKVTLNANLHPTGDFRVVLTKNGKWTPDMADGLTQGPSIVPFAGSKSQYLLDQLTFRQISNPKMLPVGQSQFFAATEHTSLTQDASTNGPHVVRVYGANTVAGMKGILLRIAVRGSPMLGHHKVADLLAQVGHNPSDGDRNDAYDKLAAGLKGSLLRIDKRPSDTDDEGRVVRRHLNESLECDKVFQHFGDADPKFTRQWREKGKPKTKCMGEYLTKRHHWELTDSRLPAANLGRSERPEWFPVSKLTTWPYQRLHCNPRDLGMSNNELLEFTRLSPIERASLMSHLVDDHISNGNADSPFWRVSVQPGLAAVNARILQPPTIEYGAKSVSVSIQGSWSLQEASKVTAEHKQVELSNILRKPYTKPFTIGVIYDDLKIDLALMKDRLSMLTDKLRQFGLSPIPVTACNFQVLRKSATMTETHKSFAEATDSLGSPDVVVYYSCRRLSASRYAMFKSFMDLHKSQLSACLLDIPGSSFPSKVCGVAAKLNAKFKQSYNHKINLHHNGKVLETILDDTLIVGARLSHPDTHYSLLTTPSIVSVVSCQPGKLAGVDDYCHYNGSVGLQRSHSSQEREYESKEIIRDLGSLLGSHLAGYQAKHNKLPARIIYYRSGINDSVIRKGLKTEIDALKRTCEQIGGHTPRITAIIVSKQSSVRFFSLAKPDNGGSSDSIFEPDQTHTHLPRPGNEKSTSGQRDDTSQGSCSSDDTTYDLLNGADRVIGNCRMGTVVDTVVVSPYCQDFYLQSHSPSAGCARPTHYRVAYDDINISSDDMQALTFNLCFGSQTASRSLSQPAPTYYAGKLASRVRLWLKDYFDGNLNECNEFELGIFPNANAAWLNMKEHFGSFLKHHPDAVIEACYTRLRRNQFMSGMAIAGPSAVPVLENPLQDCMFWL